MTNGSLAFLVDTNVFVYAHDRAAGPKRSRAIDVLANLESNGLGALSTQVLGEFFNISTRKIVQPLTKVEAERQVSALVHTWPVFDITGGLVIGAAGAVIRHRFSYWDALIWATAKFNGVPNVLSEDFSDGATVDGVKFVNPFTDRFVRLLRERRRGYAIR
jgi:predicted nucleic acid-binding protein